MILDVGCHYLVQIKRNCRTLWENMALYTALTQPISTCEYYQKGHDHRVWRRVELYETEHFDLPVGWTGVQRIIKVWRRGYRKDQYFEQRAFYILSKPMNSALHVARIIQNHWSIENNLHWIKDVNLREDELRGKNKDMVSLMVYLNNLALNILRTAGYKPVKDTFAKFANKVSSLHTLF